MSSGKIKSKEVPSFPPTLLARLTGKLGDKKTIERISSNFGQSYSEFLPIIFKEEIDIDITASYLDCKSGKFSQIISYFNEHFIFYNSSLKGWTDNFFVACSNDFIIKILERLLNTDQEITQSLQNRTLSIIEQKLAKLILTKICTTLNQLIAKSQNTNQTLGGPYDIDVLKKNTHPLSNEFVTAINIEIKLGTITSLLTLILTQETLLKTNIKNINTKKEEINKTQDTNDPLINKAYDLYVNVETRAKLKQVKIKDILQLKVGQIIPFLLNREKNHVTLNINGKDTYSCELGRIGNNYTVRIKERIIFDKKNLSKILNES
ncbi:flagellar motor switch protein FliM [Candidatus Liberibacter americanus]|uniref:Flagellar motor switch protein FliM n=1 Tax=Candidatus Liberibacter americanus str. Sao Paulo TaxID=1261131 RepID=U6B3J2_9HYPH|nr:FliM/FliN family flagellar motor switch protein [Candidatus Liberibacter americanus]AHA27634.1 Flagellar motor switch protein FliM [Candidatus Liberibacter americanus str. Sao Paulo]EMS36343.1 surface presentation of antigens (SPOA) protein [Candidatus Liberibacter americanus PW_SP]